MKPLQAITLSILLSLPHYCGAHSAASYKKYGLVGYGIEMHSPVCAFTCKRVLEKSQLNCSTPSVADRWHGGSGLGFETSAECFASDNAFLVSLAWCLRQRCGAGAGSEIDDSAQNGSTEMVPDWKIVRFWERDAFAATNSPKYTLSKALSLCETGIQHVQDPGEPLEIPSEIRGDWMMGERSLRDFAWVEAPHSRLGLLLLFIMCSIPPFLTLVHFAICAVFPVMERLLLVYLIYRPISMKQNLIFYLLGESESPTYGQTLLVVLIIVLNILFTSLGYRGSMPNMVYGSPSAMAVEQLANRAGVLAFVNLSVIFLYSCRWNPLIRIAGWSRATFILLHRWIAYICIVQAALHSVIYFWAHIPYLAHKFTQAYWNLGLLGMLMFLAILPTSFHVARHRWYECFLDSHVALAFGVLIACYYHIYFKFEHNWGYENWVLLATSIWTLEKIMRWATIVANGLRKAKVVDVDDEYFTMNIEGAKGIGMAYLFFPTAGWRIWENHPFSIMSSVITVQRDVEQHREMLTEFEFDLVGSDFDSDSDIDHDAAEEERKTGSSEDTSHTDQGQSLLEKKHTLHQSPHISGNATPAKLTTDGEEEADREADIKNSKTVTGLAFLVRRQTGATGRLFTHSMSMPVLLEGSYSTHWSLATLAATAPRVVCIAGGVGITPILPIIRARVSATVGSTSLYFGTRSERLVVACGLKELQREVPDLDVHIRVSERWDLREVVLREAGWTMRNRSLSADVIVIVCGPRGMVHDTRWAVIEANQQRRHGVVKLIDESFRY